VEGWEIVTPIRILEPSRSRVRSFLGADEAVRHLGMPHSSDHTSSPPNPNAPQMKLDLTDPTSHDIICYEHPSPLGGGVGMVQNEAGR
jgi:hypothetical protein